MGGGRGGHGEGGCAVLELWGEARGWGTVPPIGGNDGGKKGRNVVSD